MNENLEKAATKALELAEKTHGFVIEQAPEIIQEFYWWNLLSSLVCFLVCLAIIIFSALNLKKWYIKAFIDYYEDIYVFLFFILAVLSVVAVVGLFDSLYDIIKLLTAPKLYLIEYFLR